MDPGGRRSLERLMEGAGCPEAIADPVIKLSPIDISELVLDPDTFVVRPTASYYGGNLHRGATFGYTAALSAIADFA